jgi:hypothetical protein
MSAAGWKLKGLRCFGFRLWKAREEYTSWVTLEANLGELEMALNANDARAVRSTLERLVESYTPSNEIVDWVHLERTSIKTFCASQAALEDAGLERIGSPNDSPGVRLRT